MYTQFRLKPNLNYAGPSSYELDLNRLVSASSNSLFKVLSSRLPPFALFLASCCSFLLHVVVNLMSIFLASRQLVLFSSLPKFLHSFCGHKGCTQLFFRKLTSRLMLIISILVSKGPNFASMWREPMHYILLFLKGMDQSWFESVVCNFLNYKCCEDKGTKSNTRQKHDVISHVTDFFFISQFRSQRSWLLASRSYVKSHLKILGVRVRNETLC